jgi:hypothetical protein
MRPNGFESIIERLVCWAQFPPLTQLCCQLLHFNLLEAFNRTTQPNITTSFYDLKMAVNKDHILQLLQQANHARRNTFISSVLMQRSKHEIGLHLSTLATPLDDSHEQNKKACKELEQWLKDIISGLDNQDDWLMNLLITNLPEPKKDETQALEEEDHDKIQLLLSLIKDLKKSSRPSPLNSDTQRQAPTLLNAPLRTLPQKKKQLLDCLNLIKLCLQSQDALGVSFKTQYEQIEGFLLNNRNCNFNSQENQNFLDVATLETIRYTQNNSPQKRDAIQQASMPLDPDQREDLDGVYDEEINAARCEINRLTQQQPDHNSMPSSTTKTQPSTQLPQALYGPESDPEQDEYIPTSGCVVNHHDTIQV